MPLSRRVHKCAWQGCNSIFIQSSHLKSHQRIHTGEKPFECSYPECRAAFSQSSHLKSHQRVHTGEKPFECSYPECRAAFSQSSHLKSHQRVHTGEKPFVCSYPECGASFSENGSLKLHMRIHTGEKPHVCTVCNDAFARPHYLVSHMRIHTGERPYRCTAPGCQAAFTVACALVTHSRTHTGERPFVCPFPMCDASFSQKGNLDSHHKAMHSEEGQQRKKQAEERVAQALDVAGLIYKREHHVSFSCWGDSFARTDFLLDRRGGILLTEVDEGQHGWNGLLCEVARMTKMHTAFALEGNTLPIGIIRFNPDAFRVDGQLCRVSTIDRLAKLVDVVRQWKFGPEGSLQIQYMYYDCHTVEGSLKLDIWNDSAYNKDAMKCCRDPIV